MGMMISFGNASGPLDPINVKSILPIKVFFTRPGLADYGAGRTALEEGSGFTFSANKIWKNKSKYS